MREREKIQAFVDAAGRERPLSREAGEGQGEGLSHWPASDKHMFDLDPGKLIVIGIVALIAIPSKDLPRVLRTLGQATGRMRRMAAEFQGQFMDAMRDAELADLKKEIEETNKSIMSSVKLDGSFDPLTEARKQITAAVETDGAPAKPAAQAHNPAPSDDPDNVDAAFGTVETPPPRAEGGHAEDSDGAQKAGK